MGIFKKETYLNKRPLTIPYFLKIKKLILIPNFKNKKARKYS
jgi:hypothetical protein